MTVPVKAKMWLMCSQSRQGRQILKRFFVFFKKKGCSKIVSFLSSLVCLDRVGKVHSKLDNKLIVLARQVR